MNVTQVAHRYPPSIGGVENYAARLTDSLESFGHSVTVLTTDSGLPAGNDPPNDDRVTYHDTTFAVSRNPVSLDLHRDLRRWDADVYHFHSPFLLPTVEAVHALPNDIPSVVTVHGFPTYHNLSATVRNLAYRPIAQYVLDRVDRTIVLGESERELLHDRFSVDPETVSVVPNGIDPDACDVSASTVQSFRHEYDIDPETPTILFVGRLVPWKNPDVLIEAMVEHLPDAKVQILVVGEGEPEYVSDLQRRADDRFTFVPGLPREELLPAYRASDLFVLVSKSEGFSTVVLEAMNAKLPVLSTRVGALADVLEDGVNGWTLPTPPNPESVAEIVERCFGDPELAETIGRTNRQYVRSAFDWADIASRIEDVYHEIVPGGTQVATRPSSPTSGD